MNCAEYLDRLDDLLAARLDAATAAAMAAHRAACDGCRAEHDGAAALALRARQLPKSLAPARDLWPEIARRLEGDRVVRPDFGGRDRRPSRAWWRHAAVAAALVAAVAVAYQLGRWQGPRVVPQSPPAADAELAQVSFEAAAVLDLERQVATIRGQLLDVLASQDLDAGTAEVVMDNLRVIDDAVARIERALAEDPGNPRLTRQLTFAYRQELNLLRRVTRLPADV